MNENSRGRGRRTRAFAFAFAFASLVFVGVSMAFRSTSAFALRAHEEKEKGKRQNYVVFTREREIFDELHRRTAVVGLFVKTCELCERYKEEFRRVAELFARDLRDDDDGDEANDDVWFIEIPDAGATPNITGAFRASNAPFVAVLKRWEWYYVTRSGETVIREPNRYQGALNAKETIAWLNAELALAGTEKEVKFPNVVDELTEDTIEAYVRDENHDVLVEFYAKWCGHCKAFEKDYEQVGAHFELKRRKEGGRVKVARLDVDVARAAAKKYNITGLPSIQFFPRGYKARGIDFRGAKRTTQRVIDFVESPQVKVDEMRVADMGPWECFDGLRDEGLVQFDENLEKVRSGGEVGADGYESIVHHVFKQAKAFADRQRWREAMLVVMCMESTPQLKNTPSGNSAQVWNFLDNAKYHVENPSKEDEDERRALEDQKYLTADGEMDWAAFRSDQAAKWRAMRKEIGLGDDGLSDDDDMFDDEDWFDFQYPEDGGARVEIPETRVEL